MDLGYATLEQLATASGVGIKTVTSLLTGARESFRLVSLLRLDEVWRLPAGTLDQVVHQGRDPGFIKDLPTEAPARDFASEVLAQLAVHGGTLLSPDQMLAAADALTAQTQMMAAAAGTLRALAALAEPGNPVDSRQQEALEAAELVMADRNLSPADRAKLRARVLQGNGTAPPAVFRPVDARASG